jgi:hypothetical protein
VAELYALLNCHVDTLRDKGESNIQHAAHVYVGRPMHRSETQQDKSHRSPRPTTCAQCEDKNSPVIEQVDGFSLHYEIVKGVTVEIFLHDDCASRWYDAFSGHSRITEDLKSYKADA